MSTSTPRRDFLARIATLTAAAACAPHHAPQQAPTPKATPRQPASLTFDDSWTAKVTAAKHRAVFDSPEVADGMGVWQVDTYLRGYKTVFDTKPGEVQPVLVLRHEGTVLAMDDALWAKYALGKSVKYKNPKTKRWYTYNPVARPHTDQEKAYASSLLEGALARGVVVLACNQALTGFAYQAAQETKQEPATVIEEFRRGLVPGVILQPSGVYASMRAQEVGCVFMRST